jgi:hypothetical protein
MNSAKEWFLYHKNRIKNVRSKLNYKFEIRNDTSETFIIFQQNLIEDSIEWEFTEKMSFLFEQPVLCVKSERDDLTLYDLYFRNVNNIYIFSFVHKKETENMVLDFEVINDSGKRNRIEYLSELFTEEEITKLNYLLDGYLNELEKLPEIRLSLLFKEQKIKKTFKK